MKTIKFMFLFSLGCCLLGLLGCSGSNTNTFKDNVNVFKDRGKDYVHAQSLPPLVVPKDIPREAAADTYRIPQG